MSQQTTDDIALSIVLPTFNERENVIQLLSELEQSLTVNYEAIVVDDDSPDLTWQAVERFASTRNNVRLLRRMNNRGLTGALNEGLGLARGRLLMWMDADLSMPPAKIPELLLAIEGGADAAVGSRYVRGGGDARAVTFLLTARLMLGRVLSIANGWLLNCRFRDWSSGFIVVKREFLEGHRLSGNYGEYFIALIVYLIKRRKANVVEVPYIQGPRKPREPEVIIGFWESVRRGCKYMGMVLRQCFVF